MQLSANHGFDFELRRMLGLTYNGGCDIEEVFEVVDNVGVDDDEGWYRRLNGLAERVRKAGDESAARGHMRSACEAYLRASIYHFFSDFYIHADIHDPRIIASGRASRDCFMASIPALDYDVEKVAIPFEGVGLPGYVVKKRHLPEGPRPVFLCHSGFDGNKEESAVFPGRPAADRGYTVLVFDGPGQGETVRELGLFMRPDWHLVVSAAVDYLLTRADVDPARIALMGISFGGVLAPMAASREHRLRALIANGGVNDFHAAVRRIMLGDEDAPVTDAAIAALRERMKTEPEVRWGVNHGKYIFGAADIADYIEKTAPFRVEAAADIRCPTLVIDSEHEQYFGRQPQQLYDRLVCEKTLMKFTSAESVATHYQAGGEAAGARKIFDWLDEVMDNAS